MADSALRAWSTKHAASVAAHRAETHGRDFFDAEVAPGGALQDSIHRVVTGWLGATAPRPGGPRIFLAPGSYPVGGGGLVFDGDAPVHLFGRGEANIEMHGLCDNVAAITSSAPRLTLDGLTLRNTGLGKIVDILGGVVLIQDCLISGANGSISFAIDVRPRASILSHVTLYRNSISHISVGECIFWRRGPGLVFDNLIHSSEGGVYLLGTAACRYGPNVIEDITSITDEREPRFKCGDWSEGGSILLDPDLLAILGPLPDVLRALIPRPASLTLPSSGWACRLHQSSGVHDVFLSHRVAADGSKAANPSASGAVEVLFEELSKRKLSDGQNLRCFWDNRCLNPGE